MIRTIEGHTEWAALKIGIAVSRWNSMITDEMLEGALATLKSRGVPEQNISLVRCPGSYELPLSCKLLLEHLDPDGVIAIGAVIRGETPHFNYVCEAVNRGVMQLNLTYNKPVAFGVLTTDTVEQALQRASKEKGNKGSEAAVAVCDMIALGNALKKTHRK